MPSCYRIGWCIPAGSHHVKLFIAKCEIGLPLITLPMVLQTTEVWLIGLWFPGSRQLLFCLVVPKELDELPFYILTSLILHSLECSPASATMLLYIDNNIDNNILIWHVKIQFIETIDFSYSWFTNKFLPSIYLFG